MTRFKPKDIVKLDTPDNPRLHGQEAVVTRPTEWGAFVSCSAAATGIYRASHEEMIPVNLTLVNGRSKEVGYTGEVCDNCQGSRMRRNGSCLLCDDCGMTTGCS